MPHSGLMTEASENGLTGLIIFMRKHLRWALHHKTFVSIIAIVVFIGSMSLFAVIKTEFFPQADESRISATIELQTGTRVDQTILTADKIDELIKAKYPEVNIISTSTGADDQGGFASMFQCRRYTYNTATVSVLFQLKKEKNQYLKLLKR